MTFYVIILSCFSNRVSGVFTHVYYIQIFRFFLLNFLNIVFIEYDTQVFKGECYNTNTM
jgi:hypothetical protein